MKHTGFTLWELLVALLVIGVVLGLGIPNFSQFSRNSDMASAVNALVSAVHLGRTEALKRATPVTLCASSAPLAPAPVCDGGDGGFFAFTDTQNIDADDDLEGNGAFDGNDEILFRRPRPAQHIMTSIEGPAVVRIAPNGYLNQQAASLTRVLYCDERGNAAGYGDESVARVVAISPTGRPQSLRRRADIAAFTADTGAVCP